MRNHEKPKGSSVNFLQRAILVSDRCPVDETLIVDPFVAAWPDQPVGSTASIPCPCGNTTQLLAARANRECRPGFNQAEWQPEDVSQCLALDLGLCNISMVRSLV